MEDRWEVYPTTIDEEFALIAVNLGVEEERPLSGLNWLMWIRAELDAGTPTGLPSAEQSDYLAAVEEALETFFVDRDSRPAGRITAPGRREFFIYASEDVAPDLQSALTTRFPDRNFLVRARRDEQWEVYEKLLYPSELDWLRINNQRVLHALSEQGDDPAMPRPIEHVARFATETARETFRAELETRGYAILEAPTEEDLDRPYELRFQSVTTLELATVEALTVPLHMRVAQLQGKYEGWSSPVVAPD